MTSFLLIYFIVFLTLMGFGGMFLIIRWLTENNHPNLALATTLVMGAFVLSVIIWVMKEAS